MAPIRRGLKAELQGLWSWIIPPVGVVYIMGVCTAGALVVGVADTLLELAEACSTTTTALSTAFVLRAVGQVLGLWVASTSLKRLHQDTVLMACLAAAIVVWLSLAYITSDVLLHFWFFLIGVLDGTEDTVAMVGIQRVYGKDAGPWLTAALLSSLATGAAVPLVGYISSSVFMQYAVYAGFTAFTMLLLLPHWGVRWPVLLCTPVYGIQLDAEAGVGGASSASSKKVGLLDTTALVGSAPPPLPPPDPLRGPSLLEKERAAPVPASSCLSAAPPAAVGWDVQAATGEPKLGAGGQGGDSKAGNAPAAGKFYHDVLRGRHPEVALLVVIYFVFSGQLLAVSSYIETFVDETDAVSDGHAGLLLSLMWVAVTVATIPALIHQASDPTAASLSGQIPVLSVAGIVAAGPVVAGVAFGYTAWEVWFSVLATSALAAPIGGYALDLGNRLGEQEEAMSLLQLAGNLGGSLVTWVMGSLWHAGGGPAMLPVTVVTSQVVTATLGLFLMRRGGLL